MFSRRAPEIRLYQLTVDRLVVSNPQVVNPPAFLALLICNQLCLLHFLFSLLPVNC